VLVEQIGAPHVATQRIHRLVPTGLHTASDITLGRNTASKPSSLA
jgi:hypothetical protein